MKLWHVFPNDSLADYWAIEATPAVWLKVAAHTWAAAEAFGLDISLPTAERWRRVSAACYWLDDLIDTHQSEEAHELYRLLVRGEPFDPERFAGIMKSQLLPIIRLLDSSLAGFDRTLISDPALEVARYAKRKARRHSVVLYILGLAREGSQTGLLLANCLTESERQQERVAAFTRWMRDAIAFGTIADSTVDLGRDEVAGLTGVYPSKDNYRIMAFSALANFLWLFRRPKPALAIAKTSWKWRHGYRET